MYPATAGAPKGSFSLKYMGFRDEGSVFRVEGCSWRPLITAYRDGFRGTLMIIYYRFDIIYHVIFDIYIYTLYSIYYALYGIYAI